MLAEDVDKLGYGDCKALTNYTMSLLKIAGIRSFYTKVRAGSDEYDINRDFVSNQTNHIILCVPMEPDTIWLECTSQTSPFGYLGDFTSDRNVFIVTPEGGKISRSVTYPAETNKQVNRILVRFASPDLCTADISSKCSGLQYENYSGLTDEPYEETKKWIIGNSGLQDIEVVNFGFQSEGEEFPEITFTRNLSIRKLASRTGKRLIVPVNFINRLSYIPVRDRNRVNDIVRRSSYLDIDTVIYVLPARYTIEALPPVSSLQTKFGEYSTTCESKGDSVIFTRRLLMNKGTYPASLYEEFRQYFIDITNADNGKLVLVEEGQVPGA